MTQGTVLCVDLRMTAACFVTQGTIPCAGPCVGWRYSRLVVSAMLAI